jgi:hypothetical protein
MNICLVLSAFSSRPISLLVTNNASVFFFIVLCFCLINFIQKSRPEADVSVSVLILFVLHRLPYVLF